MEHLNCCNYPIIIQGILSLCGYYFVPDNYMYFPTGTNFDHNIIIMRNFNTAVNFGKGSIHITLEKDQALHTPMSIHTALILHHN